jgi:hypothetical protein
MSAIASSGIPRTSAGSAQPGTGDEPSSASSSEPGGLDAEMGPTGKADRPGPAELPDRAGEPPGDAKGSSLERIVEVGDGVGSEEPDSDGAALTLGRGERTSDGPTLGARDCGRLGRGGSEGTTLRAGDCDCNGRLGRGDTERLADGRLVATSDARLEATTDGRGIPGTGFAAPAPPPRTSSRTTLERAATARPARDAERFERPALCPRVRPRGCRESTGPGADPIGEKAPSGRVPDPLERPRRASHRAACPLLA